ncbi:hypothetical protein JCM6882_005620 [Rhodosporidiobolus microsporus]
MLPSTSTPPRPTSLRPLAGPVSRAPTAQRTAHGGHPFSANGAALPAAGNGHGRPGGGRGGGGGRGAAARPTGGRRGGTASFRERWGAYWRMGYAPGRRFNNAAHFVLKLYNLYGVLAWLRFCLGQMYRGWGVRKVVGPVERDVEGKVASFGAFWFGSAPVPPSYRHVYMLTEPLPLLWMMYADEEEPITTLDLIVALIVVAHAFAFSLFSSLLAHPLIPYFFTLLSVLLLGMLHFLLAVRIVVAVPLVVHVVFFYIGHHMYIPY